MPRKPHNCNLFANNQTKARIKKPHFLIHLLLKRKNTAARMTDKV